MLVQTVKILIHLSLYSDDTNFSSVNGSRLTAVNRSEVGTNGLYFGMPELSQNIFNNYTNLTELIHSTNLR